MTVTVLIPTPLQKFSQDQASLDLEAKNIQELIEALEQACPGMKERICDEEGKLRRFLNFYVNGDDIRFLEGQTTPLPDGAEVSIVPAVAGG
jgi:molybdopterin converting factor small subunit